MIGHAPPASVGCTAKSKLPLATACLITLFIAAIVFGIGGSNDSPSTPSVPIERASTEIPETEVATLAQCEHETPRLDQGLPYREPHPAEHGTVLEFDAIVQARDDLEAYSQMSLEGVMHVNATLDRLLTFASLPVSAHPELEYQDGEVLAYRLKGTPAGDVARVMIGTQPYFEEGRQFRYLQLEVEVDSGTSSFLQGLMRENCNVDLSISYDVTEPTKPTRFAMMVQRPVDIARCRDKGIDVYHGAYTNGSYYWLDLLGDPYNPTSGTVGFVDARPANIFEFDGVRPLAGDLELDPDRLALILGQLQAHLATIKGE